MINPIKSNIGLRISSEPSPEVLKSFKILLAESYLVYMSMKRTCTWH